MNARPADAQDPPRVRPSRTSHLINSEFMRSAIIDGRRTRYYDSAGSGGSPILLLHGGHFGATIPMALETFSENLDAISRQRRVLALDRLGQGGTEDPRPGEWTFDAVHRHAACFIRELGLTALTLVGHSRGGLVAASLALALPDLVETLVIVASATTAPESDRWPSERFYAEFARTAPWDRGELAVVKAYQRAQAGTREWDEQFVRLLADRLASDEHRSRMAHLRVHKDQWARSLLDARCRVRDELRAGGFGGMVHLVWGAEDVAAPPRIGVSLLELLTGHGRAVSLHVLPAAGHYVFRDNSTAFNRLLLHVA